MGRFHPSPSLISFLFVIFFVKIRVTGYRHAGKYKFEGTKTNKGRCTKMGNECVKVDMKRRLVWFRMMLVIEISGGV